MEIFNLIKQLSKNSFSLANNSFRLMRLEMALAKKSLPVLAGLLFLLLCFVISLWVFLIATLVVYLGANGIVSIKLLLWGLFTAHVLLIIIVALLIRKYLNNLKLSATRRHLKSVLFKQP